MTNTLITPFEKKRTDIIHFLNERYPNGIGCEVGVLRGEFSKHLLSNWNCKKLYLVDCWEDHPEDYDELFHDHNTNFQIMNQNLLPFHDRIQICKGYSDKIVHNFNDEMFDFIYIDANHSYEGCKLDLDLYWKKLKKGGIIMGDDYHINDIDELQFNGNKVVFGVTKAVKEFTKEHNKIFDISYIADWYYPSLFPARNFVIQK
jgi:predicted O-methyltransferase YrrM